MSIFFLVVAVLVAGILVSQLTWRPAWGERRSVRHHEHAMDVLRSLSSRRIGSENAAAIEAGEHPRISPAGDVAPDAASDEILPAASAGAQYEMVRLLSEEPASAASLAAPPGLEPVKELASTAENVARAATAEAEEATLKPSFVFFAEDGGDDLITPVPALPGPPSPEDVAGRSPSRARALLLAISQMERPRLGLAVGLVTVVVMATVLGTLVGLMSTSSKTQRVRQVAAPPTTIAPAPAPSPTTPSTVVSEAPPPTYLPSSTTTPTTSIPTPVRNVVSSPPSTTTPTPPPTTSPPTTSTPASVVSSTPSTAPPPTTTPPTTKPPTTTTSTTPPTTTTTKP